MRLEEFTALLHGCAIGLLADIRKIPMSGAHPQFNAATLGPGLAASQIAYAYFPELGGRRPRARDVPAEVNGHWENQSFHNYADYALSDGFHQGLHRLIDAGRERRVAMMCAESLWWRCHRRIVADYLLAAGETVFHIMGDGRQQPAKLTAGAIIRADGRLAYPATTAP